MWSKNVYVCMYKIIYFLNFTISSGKFALKFSTLQKLSLFITLYISTKKNYFDVDAIFLFF